jgi:PEP-CTERM motif
MKGLKFLALLLCVGVFAPVDASAQAPLPEPATTETGSLFSVSTFSTIFGGGVDLLGMTVTAFTDVGAFSAAIVNAGGSIFEAQTPGSIFGTTSVVQYCDALSPCAPFVGAAFAPFAMQPGTWSASFYGVGVNRLLFNTGTSNTVFTGGFNWLAQFPSDPALDYGSVTFRDQVALNGTPVNGAWSEMDITFEPFQLSEAPFSVGLASVTPGGSTDGGGPTVGVPEPGVWMLMLAGAFGLGFVAWRRREEELLA